MTVFVPPSLRHLTPKHLVFSAWLDHSPFGYDLVAELRPEMLVELGTHNGQSYFTFCQSIKDHGIDGLCFAVDTWEGDEQSGPYGDEVYGAVEHTNRENYPGFSYLLRTTFAEAAGRFSDESVDLLHIDGLHTYDAVRADFEGWWPKVRPGGIVLMHDIQSRMDDYAAWRFWEEVRGQYPSFAFHQGFGLGVLRKPGGPPGETPLLRTMFAGTAEDHADLRALYAAAARYFLLSHWAQNGQLPPAVRP